jgi:putative membrane protein
MMWWGSGQGWIWMVLTWAIVIGLVVWVVARLAPRNGTQGRHGAGEARRILDERFARGEIDDEEYRRRRRELES